MVQEIYVRKAGVAGKFYAANKTTLEREIAMYLENSLAKPHFAPIKALIAPHAGYMYSGGVAARAYRQVLNEKYQTVVVLAPSHHESFGGISIFSGHAYDTPLGKLENDIDVAGQIAASDDAFHLSLKGHSEEEHALEVQLPFLHESLAPGFRIVPIVMGEQHYQISRRLAHALVDVLGDKSALVVASTDLSHFFPDEIARKKDGIVRDKINNFDIMGLSESIENKDAQMCGFGPTLTAMIYGRLQGASKSEVLLYRNSADVTGDKTQVVGYLSAMIY